PVGEQLLAEALLGRGGQEAAGDDLVGIDVARGQHDGARVDFPDGGHVDYPFSTSRGSVTRPRMAEAAAVSGLASRVRAPTPCRPSKLRLLVLTAYSPVGTVSPFMPRHIEHPDSRQSAPASMKMRSRPSFSASRRTCCEPGTMSRCTPL